MRLMLARGSGEAPALPSTGVTRRTQCSRDSLGSTLSLDHPHYGARQLRHVYIGNTSRRLAPFLARLLVHFRLWFAHLLFLFLAREPVGDAHYGGEQNDAEHYHNEAHDLFLSRLEWIG